MEKDLDFKIIGLAKALKQNTLEVPPNQREYSWVADAQVKELLLDINKSLRKPDKPYFLGTIVLTTGKGGKLEIADGQQRLATTTMILAAIRDWFRAKGDTDTYKSIETDFLFSFDRVQRETISKLTLNVDDNEYFKSKILNPQKNSPQTEIRRSHRLIAEAYQYIKSYIENIERNGGETNTRIILNDWITYLEEKANVVMLIVANAENAFMMFETLNDRGLKTSQVDLVKNYIFNVATDRLYEAQRLWSSMKGAVESVSDDDDIMIDFLRAACCLTSGLTTKKEIMKRIQDSVQSKTQALQTMTLFEELSKEYATILNPDHPRWNDYNKDVRSAITAINLFGVTQIRPLMLAVANKFNKQNTATAYKKIVSWSVRFMIMGIRGGRLDEGYAKLAHKIYIGEIRIENDLKREAEKIVVGDAEFQSAFENAKVGVSKIARYYLRSLETTLHQEGNPEFVPNESNVINLEHIMPESINVQWAHLKQQDIDTHLKRIGNLALMQAQKNSDIGNASFEEKKKIYSTSSFLLTSQLNSVDVWDTKSIEQRQKTLAELAVKTWSL